MPSYVCYKLTCKPSTNSNLIRNIYFFKIEEEKKNIFFKNFAIRSRTWTEIRPWFQKSTVGLSRLNDFIHAVAIRNI